MVPSLTLVIQCGRKTSSNDTVAKVLQSAAEPDPNPQDKVSNAFKAEHKRPARSYSEDKTNWAQEIADLERDQDRHDQHDLLTSPHPSNSNSASKHTHSKMLPRNESERRLQQFFTKDILSFPQEDVQLAVERETVDPIHDASTSASPIDQGDRNEQVATYSSRGLPVESIPSMTSSDSTELTSATSDVQVTADAPEWNVDFTIASDDPDSEVVAPDAAEPVVSAIQKLTAAGRAEVLRSLRLANTVVGVMGEDASHQVANAEVEEATLTVKGQKRKHNEIENIQANSPVINKENVGAEPPQEEERPAVKKRKIMRDLGMIVTGVVVSYFCLLTFFFVFRGTLTDDGLFSF